MVSTRNHRKMEVAGLLGTTTSSPQARSSNSHLLARKIRYQKQVVSDKLTQASGTATPLGCNKLSPRSKLNRRLRAVLVKITQLSRKSSHNPNNSQFLGNRHLLG